MLHNMADKQGQTRVWILSFVYMYLFDPVSDKLFNLDYVGISGEAA